MGDHERRGWRLAERPPDRHFYAAYVFEDSDTIQPQVTALVKHARELGYPVRYWWLSEAMTVEGFPDRLIICVHHPASDENAGMDLYTRLQENNVIYGFLEAATPDEYVAYSRPIEGQEGIYRPDGSLAFSVESSD